MKHKVHWLIDGLIEVEAKNCEYAEKLIKEKIEAFVKKNSNFFEEVGAKAVQGQAYLPGKDEWYHGVFFMLNQNKLIFYISICSFIVIFPSFAFSKGKIYGNSKTLSKDYIKYENCRLRQTLLNIKDGEKDGYKCIYKRQSKEKDVTVFQPSAICQKSFKCKKVKQ